MKTQVTAQQVLFYITAYLLWLVNVVVCVVALLEFRSIVNMFWLMSGRSVEVLGVANQVIVLLGGLVVLVYVFFLESYYRRCVARLYALLWRAAWTTAIPIGVLIASVLARYLAFGFVP